MSTRSSRRLVARTAGAALTTVGVAAGLLVGGAGAATSAAPDSATAAKKPVLISATSEYAENGRVRLAIDRHYRAKDRVLGYLAGIDTNARSADPDFRFFWAPDRGPRLTRADGTSAGCHGVKHRTKPDGAMRLETFYIPARCLGSDGATPPKRIRVSHELDVQHPRGGCSIDILPEKRLWQIWLTPGHKTTDLSTGGARADGARGC